MMHTKKIILVPSDITEKKKPIEAVMRNINLKMKHILDNKSIPDDVRLAQFNHLLQNYNRSLKTRRKPYELMLNELKGPISDTVILQDMPKTQLKNAQNLLSFVKRNPLIEIDEGGNVSISGEKLKGANIVDLIHDFSRNTKSTPAPGALQFAHALTKLHVPTDIIGNKYRHNLFTVNEDEAEIFWDENL